MSHYSEFDGRRAIVTGGTRGIGLSIAKRLCGAGAHVVVTGTAVREAEAVQRLRDAGADIAYRSLDLDRDESLSDFCDFLRGLDRLDILVNNAGVNQIVPAHEIEAHDYDRLHRVNLRGPMLTCSAAVPTMRREGWGRIVNVASIWATITKPGRAMYTASKFGLVGLTKTLAVENARHGILVNAISPGFTMTELTRSTLSSEEIEALAAQVPIGRFATPQEIAEVVAFLCSPLNSYMTAQNITVDGGFISI